MARLLNDELEEVVMKCHDTTRIDSPVRSGSDSDEDNQTRPVLDTVVTGEEASMLGIGNREEIRMHEAGVREI